jgi:hypothetical protein
MAQHCITVCSHELTEVQHEGRGVAFERVALLEARVRCEVEAVSFQAFNQHLRRSVGEPIAESQLPSLSSTYLASSRTISVPLTKLGIGMLYVSSYLKRWLTRCSA